MPKVPLLVGIVLLANPVALAQPVEPASDLPAEVERLVRDLDANQLARRQGAEQALIELGPAALEFLPRVSARTPAEVKERLGRVRTAFEKAFAERVATPSRVTLSGEMALTEALAAFEEQTGNRIVGYERRSGKVELELNDVPYWEALDQLLDQAELDIDHFGGETNALVLTARADGESPRRASAAYSSAFRFGAARIETRRDLRNPSVNGMRLTLGVTWEPRIRPISLQLALDLVAAIDDRGESLEVDSGRVLDQAPAETGVSGIEMIVPFALPERGAKEITSFNGVLMALVPGSDEKFEFTDLSSAVEVEQQRAGVTVTFERMRKNGDLYEVRVRVRYDDVADALQSHQGWIYQNEAYLLDAEGERVDNLGGGFEARRGQAGEVGLGYLFPAEDVRDGSKFVYETPATILRLPVKYELKDIPLP